MPVITDPKKIKELLERAIEKIYPSREALEKVLKSGKRLKIYFGVDPTASTLHLDHGTTLFILKRLQGLGHEVILLIGDFTAQIGDPTGKASTRKQLLKEEILKNYKNYKKEASKILDFNLKENPAKIFRNSQWWGKMSLKEMMGLMTKITISKLLDRDMFQRRIKEGKEIYLHEFIYPLLQGYDSVALDVDIEIGGTDQIFNMLVGRDLVKTYKTKEKYVIAKKLLENPKTGRILMSKSEGNFIGLDEKPSQMYGKIMALPDEIIPICFEHWTEVSMEDIKNIKESLRKRNINPRKVKARLAREVVAIYYTGKAALGAEKEFDRVFKEKKTPSKISTIKIKEKNLNILDLLVKTKLTISKAEAKRLILQKGIRINGEVQDDWKKSVEIKKELIIQVGRRKFIKII